MQKSLDIALKLTFKTLCSYKQKVMKLCKKGYYAKRFSTQTPLQELQNFVPKSAIVRNLFWIELNSQLTYIVTGVILIGLKSMNIFVILQLYFNNSSSFGSYINWQNSDAIIC